MSRRTAVRAAIVFLLAATAAPVQARTLTGDVVWSTASGPITVSEDIVVSAGSSLTIEPGVTVELAAGVSLTVEGRLVARGTAEEPILFRPADVEGGATWGPIAFQETAESAAFAELDRYESGSILEHCVFEGGERALVLSGSSPLVRDSVFRGCHYEAVVEDEPGGAAILIEAGASPRIVGCTFEDNEVDGRAWGGAIAVVEASPIIQGNRFVRNESVYGGALVTIDSMSPIVGNTFEDNGLAWEGGGVSLYSSSPAFLDNVLIGNRSTMDGGAVHVCVGCFPHANPFFLDNHITDNVCQLLGAGGIGTAYVRAVTGNDLHGNTAGGGEPADFAWFNELFDEYPDWVVNTDVSGNWWGTSDADAIAATIHDGADGEAVGLVSWTSATDGPVAKPTLRATLTTRKIIYDRPGEPFTAHLTVYNPGAAREVDLLILLEWSGLGTTPYRGTLDIPGATLQPDGSHRVTLPAGTVHYETLLDVPHAPTPTLTDGTWHIALFDATTAAALGERLSARFLSREGE